MDRDTILTPENSPNDEVVGKYWGGYSHSDKTTIFFCFEYQPRNGYWMRNIFNPEEVHNISERAIRRTYWPAEERATEWYIPQWHCSVKKQF